MSTIGAVALSEKCVVGGEDAFPFTGGNTPNQTKLALEITDTGCEHWAPTLQEVYKEVSSDPVNWAKAAAEKGAELIFLNLRGAHQDRENKSPDECAAIVKDVLDAVELPLIIKADGSEEKINSVMEAVGAAATRPCLIGSAEEQNYRTLAVVANMSKHFLIAESPIDVNIAKQVNILLTQANFPLDRIIMDPLTGGLGYGLEYTYSVMERLRLQAFGGDDVVARPFICFVGDEAWRVKEVKIDEPAWGDTVQRGIIWELTTAWPLVIAGANIVTIRHPETLKRLKQLSSQEVN